MTTTTYQQEPDQSPPATPAQGNQVESAILQVLHQRGSCTLDVLLLTLTHFTFNQVLLSVDRLSREGKLTLRRPKRFDYVVSTLLPETHSHSRP